METQSVEPALGVLYGAEDIVPGEALVVGGVAVGGKTGVDELALLVREEFSSVWVVVDEPVGSEGYQDRGDALEDENPAPAMRPDSAAHKANAIGQDATEGSGKSGGSEEE